MKTTTERRVGRGARLLDNEWDGWETEIDLDRLDMSTGYNTEWCGGCILAQLYGGFGNGKAELGLDPESVESHGFEAGPFVAGGLGYGAEYADLQKAWTELIDRRRDA